MKRKIILVKVFFVFFIFLQGCNNIKHETKGDEKKTFTFSPDLNDKYHYEKLWRFYTIPYGANLGIQTYRGTLVVGKIFNEKFNSFINRDIYEISQCVLFNDDLYVEISNGSTWTNKAILLKIEMNKYEIIGIESSDIGHYVFVPQESTLGISLNKFHVGDTIVGEISLSYRDSLWNYKCNGHFMGVIDQSTEEWKEMFHKHSGKHW